MSSGRFSFLSRSIRGQPFGGGGSSRALPPMSRPACVVLSLSLSLSTCTQALNGPSYDSSFRRRCSHQLRSSSLGRDRAGAGATPKPAAHLFPQRSSDPNGVTPRAGSGEGREEKSETPPTEETRSIPKSLRIALTESPPRPIDTARAARSVPWRGGIFAWAKGRSHRPVRCSAVEGRRRQLILKPCREQRTPGPDPSFPLPALVLTGVGGATMATVAEGARLARWDSWHFVAIWGCRGLPGAIGGYWGLSLRSATRSPPGVAGAICSRSSS